MEALRIEWFNAVNRADKGECECVQEERKAMDAARRMSKEKGANVFVSVMRGCHNLRTYENGQR